MERLNDSVDLWHPSLTLNADRRCATFPGGLLFGGSKPIQSVYLKDHLYIGGVHHGSKRGKCRLFEYSVALNTWDIFDIDLVDFALVSYQSKLTLLGGRECKFDCNGFCSSESESSTKKVWILDDQYLLQEANIPSMNKPRKSALAISHEERLIIVGGDEDESGQSVTIEVYDGRTKKWLFAPTLPKSSGVQSIVVHDGNFYVQLRGLHHQLVRAALKSLQDSCTSAVQENSSSTSFWKTISSSVDRVFSNLVLCQDHLLLIGGHDSRQDDNKYVFVYQPSGPTQQWIDIADVPVDLSRYTTNMAHIVSLSGDQFLLLGQTGRWTEEMFHLSFHVAAVNLTGPFKLRHLDKLKAGTDLPVFRHLEPYTIELKERLGLEDRSRFEIFFSAEKGDTNPLQTIFIRWINSCGSIKPTWKNLIQVLEEFDEKKFAERLKLYLTTIPERIATKKTIETIKKLECIKLEIEQLRGQNLLKDASIEIHQQLQECVKLCDSTKKLLTEECQELDAKQGELMKEKEELNMQLEFLKQSN